MIQHCSSRKQAGKGNLEGRAKKGAPHKTLRELAESPRARGSYRSRILEQICRSLLFKVLSQKRPSTHRSREGGICRPTPSFGFSTHNPQPSVSFIPSSPFPLYAWSVILKQILNHSVDIKLISHGGFTS